MKSGFAAIVSACLLLSTPMSGMAENSTRQSGYTVHHNAFPTAILTPDIASNYQIIRSKYRGMLNVSVIKDEENTTGTPVSAQIDARSTNLTGQIRNIPLREIREGRPSITLVNFPSSITRR